MRMYTVQWLDDNLMNSGYISSVLNHQYLWHFFTAQPNAGFMLGQRRRRWPNMKPALGQRLVLAGRAQPTLAVINPREPVQLL